MRARIGLAAVVLCAAAALALAACDAADTADRALAAACMRASDDNRVRLSSSLISNATIRTEGDAIEVVAQVPVGIGIDAVPKFKTWTYRCRREGDPPG